MILLNFSHPLTPEQLQRIGELSGQPLARVVEVPTRLDHEQPFAEQGPGWSPTEGLIEEALG